MGMQLPSKDPYPIISGIYETDLYNNMPIFLVKKDINYLSGSSIVEIKLHK